MAECIFCKIAKNEVGSYKIYDNGKYIAFLDLFPNIKGQTLVIPKKHNSSNILEVRDSDFSGLMLAAKKVAELLGNKLKVHRVHLAIEGTGINHLHAKLYPAIGMSGKKFKYVVSDRRIYFKKYEGYVSTLSGPKASKTALKKLQKNILGH